MMKHICKQLKRISQGAMVFALMLATYSASAQCVADYSYETDTFGFTNFQDLSTGDSIVSWIWDLGDGNVDSTQNPSHYYAIDSVYTVRLLIVDTASCTDSIDYLVYVCRSTCGCTADFTYNKGGSVVNFNDFSIPSLGANITNWYWDFGDGNTDTLQSPAHNYSLSGQYNVTLIIVDDNWCTSSTSLPIDICFGPCVCLANFTFNVESVIDSTTTVSFTDLSVPPAGDFISSWMWDFGDGNISQLRNPTHLFVGSSLFVIKLSIIADSTKCEDSTQKSLNICAEACVWPGDANNDGVADIWDILQIGVAYGATGAPRVGDGSPNEWRGFTSADWTGNFRSGLNKKYADANGDGIVGFTDLDALILNYGQTHNKQQNHAQAQAVNLFIEFDKDSVQESELVTIHIMLGSADDPAIGVYGLAFRLEYDVNLIDSASWTVDFGNTWLDSSALNYYYDDAVLGFIDIGIIGNDQFNRDGDGEVASASFIIEDNIDDKVDIFKVLKLTPLNLIVISSAEDTLNIGGLGDSVVVQGLDEPAPAIDALSIRLFPNPAQDHLHLITKGALRGSLRIKNILGSELLTHELTAASEYIFDISELRNGTYFVQIDTNLGMTVKKLLVIR